MSAPITYKPIATMITCREDDEDAMVTLREYRQLERENARLKDTLKTGEMPDPVWSKDDLCFMYRKALEERDELARSNDALKADTERLDWLEKSQMLWEGKDWLRGPEFITRAAIDAARKGQP